MAKPLDEEQSPKVPKRVYVELANLADMDDQQIDAYASQLADWLRPQLQAQVRQQEAKAQEER
jgi:hypothetical protein